MTLSGIGSPWLWRCSCSPAVMPARARKSCASASCPPRMPQQVMQNAQPIVEILRKQLAMEVQPFVATDYTGVVEALRVNKLDIAFLTPASYVLAKNETNVRVVLKSERKGMPSYYAAIIIRADSGIRVSTSCAVRVSRSATRYRPPVMCFRARCSRSAASTRCAISSRSYIPAATTPRCWRCSMAKSTPAPPTRIRRTAKTRRGCAT